MEDGMSTLTVKGIEGEIKAAKRTGKPCWLNDGGIRGGGSLVAHVTGKGASFYFDHRTSSAKRDRLPIGPYSSKPQEGCLTLEQARIKVGEYSTIYRDSTRDVRLHLEQKRLEHEKNLEKEKYEREKASAGTLRGLLGAYVDKLKAELKPSSKDVASFLRLHVIEPFPDLVARPANSLGKRDFTPIFDRMEAAGLGRALGKVRSALHSAYNKALKSEKAGLEPFRAFHVEVNPIAGIDTYKELSVPGERVLTIKELQHYLRGIDALTNQVMRRAMLLQVYLGGQRPAQLFRVTAADIDLDRNTITQFDGKGKRQHPRAHLLPLTPQTRQWVEDLLILNQDAPGIFSTDGKSTIWPETASGIAHEIGGGEYRLGDIRRTVETELGRLRIPKEIKAQLLSHGQGGVQSRHYDRYLYFSEKFEALTLWGEFLDSVLNGGELRTGCAQKEDHAFSTRDLKPAAATKKP
jgi:integrase